ncbi:MAG TPA: S16 family serine protease [Gaiellaceae bacterium]
MQRRLLSPAKLAGGAVFLLVLTALILYAVPSHNYLLLPDKAHPVGPLVTVQGAHKQQDGGGIYFVDVFERRASVFESLFPWIHNGSTLVPASLIVPPGVSDQAAQQADLRAMAISQKVAAAVALRRLGYKVVVRPSGVIVAELESTSHAAGKVQSGDVIVSVNGGPTPTIAQLRTAMAKVKPGAVVSLAIVRGSQHLIENVKTMPDPTDKNRAIVGFAPEQAAQIKLPIKVRIDTGNVGGPSAGLAFALEVMEKLGHDVDHGYRVAATGEIELNGAVTAIGGVKQKTVGAHATGVDVFLVPVAGDNAKEAEHYAHGLRIIPVKSFAQALHALATLPPKH